jgi:hypothetical protein
MIMAGVLLTSLLATPLSTAVVGTAGGIYFVLFWAFFYVQAQTDTDSLVTAENHPFLYKRKDK